MTSRNYPASHRTLVFLLVVAFTLNGFTAVLLAAAGVTGVTVSAISQSGATATVAVTGADGSRLYLRYRTGGGSWVEHSSVVFSGVVLVGFTLTGLTSGEYEVEASFDSGFPAVGTVSATFTTLSPVLTGVTVSAISQSGATATVAVTGANGSRLYLRYRTGGGSWVEDSSVVFSGVVLVGFTLTGLTSGSGYEVEASFDSGFPAVGTVSATFTTLSPVLTGVTVSAISQSGATATVAVTGANGSRLYLRYRTGGGSWVEDSSVVFSGVVLVGFTLTGLTSGSGYEVEASFDSGFPAVGTVSATFTTLSPVLTGVTVSAISQSGATATVAVTGANGSRLYLRYRTGGGSWVEDSSVVFSGVVLVGFTLTGLTSGSGYEVEASFDSGFPAVGTVSATFTTLSPVLTGVTVSAISQSGATATVAVTGANGSRLYLRYRTGGGSWVEDSSVVFSGVVLVGFTLTGLTSGSGYEVEASFDSGFPAVGTVSATFTTLGYRRVKRVTAPDISETDPNRSDIFGCGEVLSCPNRNVTREEFVTFLWKATGKPLVPYSGSEAFVDVEEGGYADASIGWAVSTGVTVGCSSGSFGDEDWRFCPEELVTRAQMATFLYRFVDAVYVGQPGFVDVEADSSHATGVAWISHFQITSGCNTDMFCPHRSATRAEAATFIYAVAVRSNSWGPGNTSFLSLLGDQN